MQKIVLGLAALCALADGRGLRHVDVKQPVRVAVTGSAGTSGSR